MKKVMIGILTIAIMLLSANVGFAAGENKDPMLFLYSIVGTTDTYVDLDAVPGEEVSFSVELFNSGTTKKTNSLFICDGITANNGGTKTLTPEEAVRNKVGSWFNFSEEEVTLNAGEKRIFDFIINVPDNVSPGTHVAVLYLRSATKQGEESDITSGGSSFKINTAFSLASAVIIRTAGEIKYDFVIGENMERKWIKDKDLTLFFTISNIGNIYDYPKASIIMYDSRDEVIYKAGKDLGVVYPDNDCLIDFLIPPEHYSADIYKIVFSLEFAKDPPIIVQREFIFDLSLQEVEDAKIIIEENLNKNDIDVLETDAENGLAPVSSETKNSSGSAGSVAAFIVAFVVIVIIVLLILLIRRKVKNR